MPSFDAIIIGAGVNGLACAAGLAGRRVLLVDQASFAGGAMHLAHATQGMDARVMRAMGLTSQDFHPALATTALSLTGNHLTVQGGVTDGPDAAAFAALHRQLTRFATGLAPFRTMTPPRLARDNEWLRLARHAVGLRAMGRDAFRDLLRMILINIYDVTQDELTDPRLQGLMAFDATLGSWLGPRSPNSLILYLNRLAMGADALIPKGGMAALAQKMARRCADQGVTLRLNTPVAEVMIQNDRACGIRLSTGEDITADVIISAISPKVTFQSLVSARHLDTGFQRGIQHMRARGATAKLQLSLRDLPDFQGADPSKRLVIAPSAEAVELAYNPIKYNEIPENPVMEIILSRADSPQPQLSALVQFAPHEPKLGLDQARAQMLENCLRQIERYAPNLRDKISAAEMLMPQDITARFGLTNWHHAELSVEQMLFNRPIQALAQYATPIAGLWLASAGSHPGGGVNGAAGWNAALAIKAAT